MTIIDAKGQACPMPVLLAKKQLDAGAPFTIEVDNPTAVENLKRLAASQNAALALEQHGEVFALSFTPAEHPVQAAAPAAPEMPPVPTGAGWAIFFGKNYVGDGDPVLGGNLAKMMLYTLTQSNDPPACVLLMNSGVRLAVDEEPAAHLRRLQELGAEVLVCGTCLDFYGLKEQLKAGRISNMYDILDHMQAAAKVLTV